MDPTPASASNNSMAKQASRIIPQPKPRTPTTPTTTLPRGGGAVVGRPSPSSSSTTRSQRSKANLPALRARLGDDLRLERQPRDGMTLTFKCFLLAGAVPPYSPFLIAVLRHYGIRLAHLTPYSIVILSVFAYLSHQFLGEPPSLDLFRWYYFCRTHRLSNYSNSSSPSPSPSPSPLKHANAVGTCHFHLREGKSTTEFIHVPWRGHFHQWKDEWLYVDDGGGGGLQQETAVPAAPAESAPSWQAEPRDTPELADLRARVADLQRRGLTGAMVMAQVIMRRLAPLRNGMRIFPPEAGLLDQNQINACMVEIFGNSIRDQETALPYNIRPRIAMATDREVVEADDGEEDSVVTPHVMLPQPFESSEELVAKDDADLESVFFKAAQYGVRLKGDLQKIKTENESLKRELEKARKDLNLSRSQTEQARAESKTEIESLKRELEEARKELNLCRSQTEQARAESKTENESLKRELEKFRAEQQSDKDSHARNRHKVTMLIDQHLRQLTEEVSVCLS